MEECGGVHIHFPSEGSGIDKVTIRGPLEDVEKAKQQLLGLAEEKVCTNISLKQKKNFFFSWRSSTLINVVLSLANKEPHRRAACETRIP